MCNYSFLSSTFLINLYLVMFCVEKTKYGVMTDDRLSPARQDRPMTLENEACKTT